MFKWLILLAIAISCSGCTLFEKDKEKEQLSQLHLKIGTGYLKIGNYPLAIKELELAKKLNSKDPFILNNLGLAYFLRQKPNLAEGNIREALSLSPDYTEARNNLAKVLLDLKKYDLAIIELKRAAEDLTYHAPEKSWTNLGMAYLNKKDFKNSKTAFKKAIQLNRNYCPAYTQLGRALYKQKTYSQAATVLDQAVRKCDKKVFDEPIYYGALSYLKMGHTETARAKLEEVIRHFPNGKYSSKAKSVLKMIQ